MKSRKWEPGGLGDSIREDREATQSQASSLDSLAMPEPALPGSSDHGEIAAAAVMDPASSLAPQESAMRNRFMSKMSMRGAVHALDLDVQHNDLVLDPETSMTVAPKGKFSLRGELMHCKPQTFPTPQTLHPKP